MNPRPLIKNKSDAISAAVKPSPPTPLPQGEGSRRSLPYKGGLEWVYDIITDFA
jgi:hypothetical protein